MGSRRKRKQRIKTALKAVTALLLVAAAVVVIWNNLPERQASNGMQEFFSDDDGKTWFSDDGTKIPPFDHNGKPAVLVKVYAGKDGKPFVAYMMKFTEEVKKKILEAQAMHRAGSGLSVQKGSEDDGLLVKRPQDREWIPDTDPRAKAIRTVAGSAGGTDLLPVRP